MKNSFFYIISLSFVLLTTIISCNNDDYSETKCLQIDLLSNQYVQAMFAELQRESFSVNPDGIFEFDDRESLQNVLTIIKYYVEQATDQDTTISINDILSLFEAQYRFQSMRSKIEDEILLLEDNDNLFKLNDPDDYFIADDYFRTLLNENGEIIIGGLHLILNHNITVGIMNNDQNAIADVLALFQYNNPLDDVFFYCNSNKNTFIVSDDSTTLSPDFFCDNINNNPLQYSFKNFSSCEEYGDVGYQWDFGDGSSSTLNNPVHTYSTTGPKTVVLKAYRNGENISVKKNINIGQPNVDFAVTHDSNGNYFFTAKTNGLPASIVQYKWEFGDGIDTIVLNSNRVSHKYIFNNYSFTVYLTVFCSNGQEFQTYKTLDVSYKENCKSISFAYTGSNLYPNHYHISGNKYIKETVSAYSGWIINLLTSKAIYLQKNNNGSYKRIKANSIATHLNGNIYRTDNNSIPDNSCGFQQTISLSNSKNNQREVICSYLFNYNQSFKVDYQSLGGYGSVNGVSSNMVVLVHNHQ